MSDHEIFFDSHIKFFRFDRSTGEQGGVVIATPSSRKLITIDLSLKEFYFSVAYVILSLILTPKLSS